MRSPRTHWTAVRTAVCNVFTAVPADADSSPARPAAQPDDAAFFARLNTELVRRPGRLAIACLATVLSPAIVAQAGSISAQPAADVRTDGATAPVPAPIPGDRASWLLVARQAAATCPGLSSAVLVAIGSLESSLGLQTGVSSAGAVGPMQFLPSTWAAYGADGDRDGVSDVMNPVDAVHGAARLLCANGGADPDRLHSALWTTTTPTSTSARWSAWPASSPSAPEPVPARAIAPTASSTRREGSAKFGTEGRTAR